MNRFWKTQFAASIFGLALLIPASIFIMSILFRLLPGSAGLYHAVAPAVMEYSFSIGSPAPWILYGPLLALILNSPLQIQCLRGSKPGRLKFRFYNQAHWLNQAISLQSILLLFILAGYLVIEHFRYT
jgi:hypothetical protein